ncbi:porin [Variovorax boronicumulans]|uniref:porin n=1 Tax=Variovorax boronicumulans TaxID=436515 RepID=UPI002475B0F8|nr:porin [Variovorax boronicumulans]
MAALAVAGVASAQSSVTLFGVVDASISGYSNKSRDFNNRSAKVSQQALTNSGYNGSRLGFRGTEDLGGGLAASFWLEAPISNDDGAKGIADFTRRSTVSLSGGFGEVRLGRDYTPTFWNDTVFDPFGTNGVGTNLINTASGYNFLTAGAKDTGGFGFNSNYARASNSIGYFLPPNLGGFYGQLQYALHENVKTDGVQDSPSKRGRYVGGRFGYANGPLDVAASYGQSDAGDLELTFVGSGLPKIVAAPVVKTANLGASYDFGPAKIFGEYSQAKMEYDIKSPFIVSGDSTLKGYLLGVTVPVGPGLIRAAYSSVKYDMGDHLSYLYDDGKANKLALGYVHNLSKRTALYATIARVSNKNGAALTVGGPAFPSNVAPKNTSTGYDFGIRHAF